jgi:hypothetical protein
MGEYAKFKGKQIKIGTCESMYYLRADQAASVTPEHGSVNPVRDAEHIRFRFPFPDEDGTEPGDFDPFERSIAVHGITAPEGVDHYSVQFSARAGYLTSLPCPESKDAGRVLLVKGENPFVEITVHRNGFAGAVGICQQRVWEGHLALVCRCGGCGSLWRYPTLADVEPIIVACRSEADLAAKKSYPPDPSRAKWWHELADRIAAGYTQALPWGSR